MGGALPVRFPSGVPTMSSRIISRGKAYLRVLDDNGVSYVEVKEGERVEVVPDVK